MSTHSIKIVLYPMQVPLGITLKNENKLAEMADILKHLQVQWNKKT